MNINCIKSDAAIGAGLGSAIGSVLSCVLFNGYTVYKHVPVWSDDENFAPIHLAGKSRKLALFNNLLFSDALLLFTNHRESTYSRMAIRMAEKQGIYLNIIHPYKVLTDKSIKQIASWLNEIPSPSYNLCIAGDLESETPCIQDIVRRATFGAVLSSQ